MNFFVARRRRRDAARWPGSRTTASRGARRRAALRDGHAGRPVEHAASARSRRAVPAAAGRADDQRLGRPRPRTIAAGCRGPRTGAASRSPRPTPRRWRARDEQLPDDGERARPGRRGRSTSRCRPGRAGRRSSRRGDVFRIVDLEGNQAVDTLFFNSRDIDERYSATETIRAQGNIYLTTGTRLMSSEGRPLLTIVADTCGRHDTLGGACSAESNQVRYALDKKHMHNCRDSFLLALARYGHGMGKRDLPNNINFFMNVPGHAGRRADLRRRRLRAGPLRRDAGRARRAGADLQLPAAQQPVQRLQPDAGATAGLAEGAEPTGVPQGPRRKPRRDRAAHHAHAAAHGDRIGGGLFGSGRGRPARRGRRRVDRHRRGDRRRELPGRRQDPGGRAPHRRRGDPPRLRLPRRERRVRRALRGGRHRVHRPDARPDPGVRPQAHRARAGDQGRGAAAAGHGAADRASRRRGAPPSGSAIR